MSFNSWLQNLKSTYGIGSGSRPLSRPKRCKPAAKRRLTLEPLEDRCLLSTFTVLNTLDSGAGSFRAAITQVNADAQPGIDTIDFAIGSGAQTIAPLTALYTTHSVVIDGTSQPGFAGTPLISISGGSLGVGNGLLTIYASNCTVEGLNLTLNRRGDGVDIYGSSNTIGGTTPGAGNVISMNIADGVYIHNGTGNVIEGNIIGAPSIRFPGRGNLYGVRIDSASNTLGGTTAGARNIISGNYDGGVLLVGSGNTVEGNYIGTDVTGTSAPAPQGFGVEAAASSSSDTIGGTAPGAGNLISGNAHNDVILGTGGYDVVQGNYIGTDVTGTKVLSSGATQLVIDGTSNLIGGTTAAARNLLAKGVSIFASGNLVQGNYIGADVTGKVSLANVGWDFYPSSVYNTIGGTTPAAGNLNGTLSAAPVLTSAVSSNGVITLSGTLTYSPNATYTLNFFGDAAGTIPIGSSSVTTDGSGKAAFTATFAGAISAGQTITATAVDTFYNTTLLSAGLTYGPALVVTGFPSTTTAGAAGAFTLTIGNIDGSTLTSYTGTVHFRSSDPQAVLPADYTFTAADQGVHTFSATFKTAGLQFLFVADTLTPGVVGGAESMVNPAAAVSISLSGLGYPTVNTPFSMSVEALDAYGNIATSYTGTVHFSSTDPRAKLPSSYTFTAADNGVHTFTNVVFRTKGQQTITAADALFGFTDSSTTDVY